MIQHTTPCSECPFNRRTEPNYLGGSEPEVYIGQVNGPFWLPCHSTHNYKQLEERLDDSKPQCAGAAIFRSHIDLVLSKLGLLALPANHERVFSTFAEFLAHHRSMSIAEAEKFLAAITPEELTQIELIKCHVLAAQGKAKVGGE